MYAAYVRLLTALAVYSVLYSSAPAAEKELTIEVQAGKWNRQHPLVTLQLPAAWEKVQHVRLIRSDDGQAIPVQITDNGSARLASWILQRPLAINSKRTYKLAAVNDKLAASAGVTVTDDGKQLHVKVGQKPVLVYNHAIVNSPIEGEPYYERSGYIHPLYSPAGQTITDDFNPNHPHQHGIMFAWRKMNFEGRETDGWDQKSQLGKVEHVAIKSVERGPVFGGFTAQLQHTDLTAKPKPKAMLNETWRVHVYAIDDYFLFDILSSQSCATDKPVTIKKIHYGGMTIRGRADWDKKHNYDFLTDAGKNKVDGNHSRPKWVDLFGPLVEGHAGVTIMDHPNNFRYPQPVRLHPKMPYFCFAPAVLDDFVIKPGKPYQSRYRFYVHQGELNSDEAMRLWHDFAEPPQAIVVTKN